MYNITFEDVLTFEKEEVHVNEEDVHRRRVYAMSTRIAKTVDDYIELDYILSKVPYDVKELEVFCSARGVLFDKIEHVK